MRRLLGSEADAFLESFEQLPQSGLRVNSLKISPSSFLELSPFVLQPLPWCEDGFVVLPSEFLKPSQHPYYAAGLYYLQDPSAMAAAVMLDPQPGDRVLDLCAAPGGKATHLAALMRGPGVLVANEVVRERADILVGVLEQWGATHCVVLSESPQLLAETWPGAFDRVLVDAPCSGEGLFRKNPAARREWTPAAVEGCSARQDRILAAAADLVRPGGRLVYSTCTFSPEENEAVVARLLRRREEYHLVVPQQLPGFSPGEPDWIAPDLARGLALERCVRIWPHRAPGEGHFFAVLEREGAAAPIEWPVNRDTLARTAMDSMKGFWEATLTVQCPTQGWLAVGDVLYQTPVSPAILKGRRVVSPGWRVGTLSQSRFVPAHALVMGLPSGSVQRSVTLEPESAEVERYLRGETLFSEGEEGWLAVTCRRFALGWGKRVGGVVKNHYPRHLRWR